MHKKNVVIGFLGTVLDGGFNPARWQRWRPTVSLFQHDDLEIERLELLYDPKFAELKSRVIKDIHQVSPDSKIIAH